MLKVEDRTLKLQIWDTAGQENFKSVTKVFYRNTHAVLLCYSISSRESFANLEHWLEEIFEKSDQGVMIFLVGTKADLTSAR